MNQELPAILYHYCSLQGLRGIIEKKHIHMTNVFWMDDTTEIFWLYGVVLRELNRRPPAERNDLHEQLEGVMKQHYLSSVFCTCFSEDPDSRSEWLEYADDGHGFAIGFDPTTFELNRPTPQRGVELKRVIYDEREYVRMAEEIIRHVKERGNQVADKFQLFVANHNTWWEAAVCKNPTFASEKEWRLIYRNKPGDGLEFRERGGRHLIPFVRFPINPAKATIREIWLGPRNQSQRNVDALSQLIRGCGYDVGKIVFRGSAVPLRPEY